jgi:acetyl esterase/lipase
MPLRLLPLCVLLGAITSAAEPIQPIARNVPYTSPAHERHVLDVYAPAHAKNLPVIFWIHGGGWQGGDKTSVQLKPQVFTARGFVFVAPNHRLLPHVPIGDIFRDVAKAVRWVQENIAAHGGDPRRIFIMGHSSGAQLAALMCTDDRYLKAEGVPFSSLKGCVAVDGDTYDLPAMIATGETRRRLHGQPEPTFGHRVKFGTEAQHKDYSAVTHIAAGKGIPPFLILHITGNPDTTAQALRLGAALKAAGVPAKIVGDKEANHSTINANLGLPGDNCTQALFAFVDSLLKP